MSNSQGRRTLESQDNESRETREAMTKPPQSIQWLAGMFDSMRAGERTDTMLRAADERLDMDTDTDSANDSERLRWISEPGESRTESPPRKIPIGTPLAIPIRLGDGHFNGTFCFSIVPDAAHSEHDLTVARTLADMVAGQLERSVDTLRKHDEYRVRAEAALAGDQPNIVYQPIFRLDTGGVEGVECLARFDMEPKRPPSEWFAQAASVGLGVALEVRAIKKALAELRTVPGDFYIAINCSPQAIVSDELRSAIADIPPQRIVLEITEHSSVDDYALLRQGLIAPRAAGMRVAIDDTGAGYASMRHILSIDPEIIKLDISLTHQIDRDRKRRALAGALLEFARHTGSTIVAEGVETGEELATLRELGVNEAQGFHFGKPLKLAELAFLLRVKGR